MSLFAMTVTATTHRVFAVASRGGWAEVYALRDKRHGPGIVTLLACALTRGQRVRPTHRQMVATTVARVPGSAPPRWTSVLAVDLAINVIAFAPLIRAESPRAIDIAGFWTLNPRLGWAVAAASDEPRVNDAEGGVSGDAGRHSDNIADLPVRSLLAPAEHPTVAPTGHG